MHRRKMGHGFWTLCRTKQAYFDMFQQEANKMPSRGLGDIVAKVASFFGFKKKRDCGCGHRQDVLNDLFPFQ
jgi:hypothetical protein